MAKGAVNLSAALSGYESAKYDTDLTDAQWTFLEPLLPKPRSRGRPPTERRRIINAIFHIIKGGLQWRLLPATFPPWKTVYHIYRRWTLNHTWEALNARLRAFVRQSCGKRCRPTTAILDSQSVKSDPHGGEVGYDAGKNIKGRKRHLLVDMLGLVLGVLVTAAHVPEREEGQTLLGRTLDWFAWLRLLCVDGGYSGQHFAQWVCGLRPKLAVEVVKRCNRASGFKVLPRRWVVERTSVG